MRQQWLISIRENERTLLELVALLIKVVERRRKRAPLGHAAVGVFPASPQLLFTPIITAAGKIGEEFAALAGLFSAALKAGGSISLGLARFAGLKFGIPRKRSLKLPAARGMLAQISKLLADSTPRLPSRA